MLNYGIAEVEDVEWQMALEEEHGELNPGDADDPYVQAFLADDERIRTALIQLVNKYRVGTAVYDAE